MGQVNGKSTIEKKTMTVTGVAVKKSDAGFRCRLERIERGAGISHLIVV
jgi:hypothetical protein